MVVVRERQYGALICDDRRSTLSEQHPGMRWLRAGIPMSLLLDLADPAGPDTRGIMEEERRAERDAPPPLRRTLAGAVSARSADAARPSAESA